MSDMDVVVGLAGLIRQYPDGALNELLQEVHALLRTIDGLEDNTSAWKCLAISSYNSLRTLAGLLKSTQDLASQLADLRQVYGQARRQVSDLQRHHKVQRLLEGPAARQNIQDLCQQLGNHFKDSDQDDPPNDESPLFAIAAIKGVPKHTLNRAKQGDAVATLAVANIITDKDIPDTHLEWRVAIQLYLTLAEASNVEAHFHLGWISFLGLGVPKSDVDAVRYWQFVNSAIKDDHSVLRRLSGALLKWCVGLRRGATEPAENWNQLPWSGPGDSPLHHKFYRWCVLGAERDWLCRILLAECCRWGTGTQTNERVMAGIYEQLNSDGYIVNDIFSSLPEAPGPIPDSDALEGGDHDSDKRQIWRIPANAVTNWSREPIAEGGFGKVYSASYYGREVAVKQLLCDASAMERRNLHQEIEVWHSLKHDNILPLLGACDTVTKPFMVSPFMKNGTLRRFVARVDSPVPLKEKLRIVRQVASGMSYLHGKNIVHGDLKPANVLLDSDYRAVISDFGMSYVKHASSSSKRIGDAKNAGGTLHYMAPEMIDENDPHGSSKETDVYAFGLLLCEVFNNGRLWMTGDGKQRMRDEIVRLHIQNGRRPRNLCNIPGELWELIKECWHQAPSQRPKFDGILDRLESLDLPEVPADISPALQSASASSGPSADRTLADGRSNVPLEEFIHSGSVSGFFIALLKEHDPKALQDSIDTLSQSSSKPDSEWKKAVDLHRMLTSTSDLVAYFDRGWIYFLGLGDQQDDVSAFLHWQQVFVQIYDHHSILKSLAGILLKWCWATGRGTRQSWKMWNELPSKFYNWSEKGAESDWFCKLVLALCHLHAIGTKANYRRAMSLIEELANQGHSVAQVLLGERYQFQGGLNVHTAVAWFRKAAEQGNAWGAWHLGVCYQSGWGVDGDFEVAAMWYRRSASWGFPNPAPHS
ncbi:uncharacterized protein BJ171DRAFT_566676 [Polychytrium aggregatum]|uniref:uncharacterized protein n=1 Tax=Polychytrium aggregatum TaxID=110093 RepID=UPI0022FDD272|nr:uncharacterized protein BJ171DRAFT_566676 [Polychytrium aggregatum]KAI9206322.1 hypothetical protein BJ171DRAFT_566676 [Polychytrium aggregatum]